jgi:putative SOS response-associated peptidase YedK
MCGRFVAASSPTLLAERFHVDDVVDDGSPPDYNVAPRANVLVVRDRADGESTRRVLSRVRWGLVPSWAPDPSVGDRMINARAETVASKPAYRHALEHRRCLIPADGFYEWRPLEPAPGSKRVRKEPTFVHRRDGEPMAFAGLWAVWKVPDELAGTIGSDDGWLRSCAIVTTRANALLAPIHDRMPVLLPETAWDVWLAPRDRADDVPTLTSLLVPAPDDELATYVVSDRVNRADNNDADLVRPVDGAAGAIGSAP